MKNIYKLIAELFTTPNGLIQLLLELEIMQTLKLTLDFYKGEQL